MKDFWNKRYAEIEYAYGTEPNQFFKKQLETLTDGKILFPAEGEGRNAIYASKNGFDVYAFDNSIEARKKAIELAKKQNIEINYQVVEFENLSYPKNYFDVLVLIFAHFPTTIRKKYHKKLLSYLKPNGIIIFEAFSKEQIHLYSGGPKQIEMLFSVEEVQNEFLNIDFKLLETVETNLDEGPYHHGIAKVVRFIGIKNRRE